MGSGQSAPREPPRPRPKISARDRAILDLKVQRDRLRQYQGKIQAVLSREHDIAREQLLQGNKDKALLALKKKKYQEQLLDQSSSQLFNLEQLCSSIEFAMVERQVFEGLKAGNTVLARLQQEVSLEEVERLMGETTEAIEYQNELSAMLSGRLEAADEEAAEQELEDILQEQADILASSLPSVPHTPSLSGRIIEEGKEGVSVQNDWEEEEEEEEEEKEKEERGRGERERTLAD